jgi:hypothetical protein
MTKDELIEMLEPYEGDTDIRLMSQPHYPFEYSIERDVFDVAPVPDACFECGLTEKAHNTDNPDDHVYEPYETFEPAGDHTETVVYLLEGRQLGYGTKRAWGGY